MINRSKPSLAYQWLSRPRQDILSGLVVAFAMIPEAIAFSALAGVKPEVGLLGAFFLSVTIAIVGGRMGMITSATGSTALLMTGLVASASNPSLGVSYLIAAGLLTGVFQILWGYLRLGYQMRFVPQGVLSGFVNALALLILQAQLPYLGLNLHHSGHLKGAPDGIYQIVIVCLLIITGLLIIYGLPRLTRVVPSQLVAIIGITGLSIGLNQHFPSEWHVPTVQNLGGLPSLDSLQHFGLPFGSTAEGKVPFSLETLGKILPTALAISLVGLMETFLTQDILDDMTDTTSNKNVEARGQGIANMVSSLFGGMAGCALVGQSVMNIENGGRTRLSTMFSGISLLLMIILGRDLLGQIPIAALVAVMITIAVSTADTEGLRKIAKIPRSDTAVMLITFAVTMLTTPHNLALGVLAGVALAGILFSRKVAKVINVSVKLVNTDELRYEVSGQLFFVSKVYFLQGFDIHEHPSKITIDMSSAHIWDQSGVAALNQVIRKFRLGGSEVNVVDLNQESLDLFERIGGGTESNPI